MASHRYTTMKLLIFSTLAPCILAMTESVYKRGLVKTQISANDIVKHQNSYSNITQHVQTFADGHAAVLGFVTPWNNQGYDVAKWFRGKFTHISPVWYQVRPQRSGQYTVTGEHDVDSEWMQEVRKPGDNGRKAKIVPRFEFLEWTKEDWINFLQGPDSSLNQASVIGLIERQVVLRGFDGVVLETGIPAYLLTFFTAMVEIFRQLKQKTELLVVIPSEHNGRQDVTPELASALLSAGIGHLVLMTYDYSRFLSTPGPNAPIYWMEKNAQHIGASTSLMLGIPMYGYDYLASEPTAITQREWLAILKRSPTIEWDEEAEEHKATYFDDVGGEHVAYYPSLAFLDSRIALAEELGVSLAFWEIGQGLLYFYDML